MSFKKWPAAQNAAAQDKPGDKSKNAPAADQPAAQLAFGNGLSRMM